MHIVILEMNTFKWGSILMVKPCRGMTLHGFYEISLHVQTSSIIKQFAISKLMQNCRISWFCGTSNCTLRCEKLHLSKYTLSCLKCYLLDATIVLNIYWIIILHDVISVISFLRITYAIHSLQCIMILISPKIVAQMLVYVVIRHSTIK